MVSHKLGKSYPQFSDVEGFVSVSQVDMELIRRVNAKQGSVYTDSDVHAIRLAYMNGTRVEDIRKKTGISRQTIYDYLSDLTSLRPYKPKGKVSRINRQELLKMIQNGRPRSEIASHFHMKSQGISMYLKRHPLSEDEKSFLNK